MFQQVSRGAGFRRSLSIVLVSIAAAPACQQPAPELQGKSMPEIAAIIGEPQVLTCGAPDDEATARLYRVRPQDVSCTWYYTDGYVAFGRNRRVAYHTPQIRHCEVRFLPRTEKEGVRQMLGSPHEISFFWRDNEASPRENWTYGDGHVAFDMVGKYQEQYGRLVLASGPIEPLPALPPRWVSLKFKMSYDEVLALLGEPLRRYKCVPANSTTAYVCEFKYPEGLVGFDEQGSVRKWSFPLVPDDPRDAIIDAATASAGK